MISMEDFVTIRNLKHKSEGKHSNRKIAEMLHISHNTVKKALESSQYNGYKRQFFRIINFAICKKLNSCKIVFDIY